MYGRACPRCACSLAATIGSMGKLREKTGKNMKFARIRETIPYLRGKKSWFPDVS